MGLIKHRIHLGDFVRDFCSGIIKAPPPSYLDVVRADSHRALTSHDFDRFQDELLDFRLLIFEAMLMDEFKQGKLHYAAADFIATYARSLSAALAGCGFSPEEMAAETGAYGEKMLEFVAFLEDQEEEEVLREGLDYFACVFSALKIFAAVQADDAKEEAIISFLKVINEDLYHRFRAAYDRVRIVH